MPLKCHSYATYTNYVMCTCEATISVYIPHKLNAVNNFTTSTHIHTFHITDVSLSNMSATLNMYVQLHYYCSLHIYSTLLYI